VAVSTFPPAGAWPKRYTLVALCFAASFICYIDRVNISVAVIAMQETFHWSETQKGLVLSTFFIGYLATQTGAGWVANRYGGKITLGIAVLWWSIFTMLTPAAGMVSFGMLLAARMALGLGEGGMYPAAYNLLGHWLPPGERSRGITLLLSGVPIGTVFALLTTGVIVEAFGWPAVFYIFGAVGLLWFSFWFRYAYDRPSSHPGVNAAERELIASESGIESAAAAVPWRRLLSHSAVWAIVVNHFCSNWMLYVLLSWLPSYFRSSLGSSLIGSGTLAAAPWLSMFVTANGAAAIADRLRKRGMSATATRKLMQTIGLMGASGLLPFAQFVSGTFEAVLLMCVALGLLGMTWSGFASCHLDIAPRYAGPLMGITNTFGTIPGIIGVAATGWLVDVTGNYNIAFLLIAALGAVGTVVWLLFGTARKIID
jgi:ACS family sodium-dependent inorganic phosphate cotransporter